MKKRRSIRKKNHDYSDPGDYFVTMCTRGREPLLGDITEDRICLSTFGMIVREEWDDLPERFPGIRLDAFTIMPNHVHGVIGAFKSLSGRRCREAFTGEYPDRRFGHLWQRDYHDHVVKDPAELDRIRQPSGAR